MMDLNFIVCYFMMKQFPKFVATKIISDVGLIQTLVLCQFG